MTKSNQYSELLLYHKILGTRYVKNKNCLNSYYDLLEIKMEIKLQAS